VLDSRLWEWRERGRKGREGGREGKESYQFFQGCHNGVVPYAISFPIFFQTDRQNLDRKSGYKISISGPFSPNN